MRLTRIEAQKRRPERRNLYADGQFLAGVSAETLARLALRVGDEIGPDQLRVIQQTEELHGARTIALRLLATRPRTEKEIRQRLREKEFGDAEIASTIDQLKQAGLVDDLEFARAFLRDAQTVRPAGPILLKRKLLLLGISRETLEEAFAGSITADGSIALARSLAEKYLRKARSSSKKETPEKVASRLSAFLARKGFPWDVIKQVTGPSPSPDE